MPRSRRPAVHPTAALWGVTAAPVAHGAVGALDELLFVGIALAIFGGYAWWMRRAVKHREQDEAESPNTEEHQP